MKAVTSCLGCPNKQQGKLGLSGSLPGSQRDGTTTAAVLYRFANFVLFWSVHRKGEIECNQRLDCKARRQQSVGLDSSKLTDTHWAMKTLDELKGVMVHVRRGTDPTSHRKLT